MKWILASVIALVIASASTAQAGVYWDWINDEVEIYCDGGETFETNGDSLDQGGSADPYVTDVETITNPSP